MFIITTDRGIVTLTYRNYAWTHEKTLGMENSIILSALLSMVGIHFNTFNRNQICIKQETKAGSICKTYL